MELNEFSGVLESVQLDKKGVSDVVDMASMYMDLGNTVLVHNVEGRSTTPSNSV